jgi:protein phosphatase
MKMVSRTHAGLQRMRNEDALRIDADAGIAVLADGMGGLMAGSEASQLAVEHVFMALAASTVRNTKQLHDAISRAHQAISEASAVKEMRSQMGSTVVVWVAAQDHWRAAYVGDSRLYHWHQGELRQLSRDHSLAQRMLDSGEVESGVDVEDHYGHVLTQGLGLRQPLDPGNCNGALNAPGQRFMLCSDGLSDLVTPNKMASALGLSDLQEAADVLLGYAMDMGGTDNISVVLIEP